ncbi:MAG: MMPL family transporter [Planctomycetota bacterium]|jgi:predicted exporter
MTRFLRVFAWLSIRHPVAVLTVFALATILAAIPATRLLRNVDNDLARLMPPALPATAAMREVRTQLGAVDVMVVAVKIEPDLPGVLPLPWEDCSAEDLSETPSPDLSAVTDREALAACRTYLEALSAYRAMRCSRRRPLVGDQTGDMPAEYLRARDAYEAAAEALRPQREALLPLAEEYVDTLVPLLEESPLVQSVDYGVRSDLRAAFAQHLEERMILYLGEPELAELKRRIRLEGLRDRLRHGMDLFRRDRRKFKESFAADPLGIAELVEARTLRYGGALSGGDAYFTAADRSMVVLIVRGLKPVLDLPYTRALVADVEARAEEALRGLEEGDGSPARAASDHLTIGYGFNYAMSAYENMSMQRDIRRTFVVSLVGVLLLFLLVYRRPAVAFLVGVPLVACVVWTLAVAGSCFERISILSAAFGAVLLGLGIDYAIHVYNRYGLQRSRGASSEDAVRESVLLAGPGILLGAVTTAAAFYGITVARFRALSELGFLAGTGVLLSSVGMLVVLPAMLVLSDRLRGRGAKTPRVARPFGFGLPYLAEGLRRRPVTIVVAVLLLTAAAAVHFGARVSGDFVDFDFQKLRSAGNPAFEMSQLVSQRYQMDLGRIICISRGGTVDEALEEAQSLATDAGTLLRDGVIREVDTILRILPAPSAQERCVRFLREEADFDRIVSDFREACGPAGFRPAAFTKFYESLEEIERLAGAPRFVRLEELRSMDGMGPLVERYLTSGPAPNGTERWKVVTFLHPTVRPSTERWFGRIAAALGEDSESRSYTSPNLVALELRRLLGEDFSMITGLVLILVIAVLAWNLWPRGRTGVAAGAVAFGRSMLVLMPVAFGSLWMLSAMLVLGWSFNQFNIVIIPVVIGIGIDDAIHIAHEHDRLGDPRRVVSSIGRAVVMTSLTTVIGFGALMSARNLALYSLGSVAALGVACCMVTSLIALPAALHFWTGGRGSNRADGPDGPPAPQPGLSADQRARGTGGSSL